MTIRVGNDFFQTAAIDHAEWDDGEVPTMTISWRNYRKPRTILLGSHAIEALQQLRAITDPPARGDDDPEGDDDEPERDGLLRRDEYPYALPLKTKKEATWLHAALAAYTASFFSTSEQTRSIRDFAARVKDWVSGLHRLAD